MIKNIMPIVIKNLTGFIKLKALALTLCLAYLFYSNSLTVIMKPGPNNEQRRCLPERSGSYTMANCAELGFLKTVFASQTSLALRDVSAYGPALFLLAKGNFLLFNNYATALTAVAVISEFGKHYMHKIRPDGSNYKSFPSGHMVLMGAGIIIMMRIWGKKSLFFNVPLIILIGLSRICLCRHDHYDVIGGSLLGLIGIYAIMAILHKARAAANAYLLRHYNYYGDEKNSNGGGSPMHHEDHINYISDKDLYNIGVIAGSGEMPVMICQKLESLKKPYTVIKISEQSENYTLLNNFVVKSSYVKVVEISLFKIGNVIKIFKNRGVEKIIMIGSLGKVKVSVFSKIYIFGFIPFIKFNFFPDIHVIKLFYNLSLNKIKGDNAIIGTIVKYMEKQGFTIIGANQIIPEIVANSENFNDEMFSNDSSGSYSEDISIGHAFLMAISPYDVGQSVIIQNNKVIGMEGVEGTDNLIHRCAEYYHDYGRRPILMKCSKNNQEMRIDMPCIGEDTIYNIGKYNFAGIVIEKNKVIIINFDKVKKALKKYNLFLKIVD